MSKFELQSVYPQGNFPGTIPFPIIRLGNFPTPLRRLHALEQRLGINELWIKMDGISSQLYGGNKVRKLEFLLGHALQQKAHEIVTFGAIGSHHTLASTIFGRSVAGMPVTAIMMKQPLNSHVLDNLLLHQIYGAKLLLPFASPSSFLRTLIHLIVNYPKNHGKNFYIIPPGGSSPQGALGMVRASFELKNQISLEKIPEPEAVIVPLGSGGTLAGLAVGFAMARLNTRIIGVRVLTKLFTSRWRVRGIITGIRVLLKKHHYHVPPVSVIMKKIQITGDYSGKGYGYPLSGSEEVQKLFHDCEGIYLDQTYTLKAASAMIDLQRKYTCFSGPVLFWYTLNAVDFYELIQKHSPETLNFPDEFKPFFAKILPPSSCF